MAIFTPDNEPYLGRAALLQFDKLIVRTLEINDATASRTHELQLTDLQRMACIVIPQAISLALSIRELIRQGYLFGAHVLVRPLAERASILLYLHRYPNEIAKWNDGWTHKGAPSLARMFDAIQADMPQNPEIRGADLTAPMNSLTHGKPDSARWNLMSIADDRVGHASSKLLHRPDLCDEVSAESLAWLAVVLGMMKTYFPDSLSAREI